VTQAKQATLVLLLGVSVVVGSLVSCQRGASSVEPRDCDGLDSGSCLADARCTLTSCDACCGQPIQLCAKAGKVAACPACNTDCSDSCSGSGEIACRAEPSCLPLICPCGSAAASYQGCIDPRLASVPPCAADCRPLPDAGPEPDAPGTDGSPGPDATMTDQAADQRLSCHGLDPQTDCLDAIDRGCHVESCPACNGGTDLVKCLDPGETLECPAIACTDCSQLDEATCWATTGCQPDYCPGCTGTDTYNGCSQVGATTSNPCPALACPSCPTDPTQCVNDQSCHLVRNDGTYTCEPGTFADCDSSHAFCDVPPPTCDGDELPAVQRGCWAGCVGTARCGG
jgi:hypothetical protein